MRKSTKDDIESLRDEISRVEKSLREDFARLEKSTKDDIKQMELRLTIKLGVIMAGGIAVIATLMTILGG